MTLPMAGTAILNEHELTQCINEAFADLPLPGSLVRAAPIGEGERSYIRDFAGKHWRDILDAEFLRTHDDFALFSVEGFRFCLPAYLIGAVRDPAGCAGWFDAVLHRLYPPAWFGAEELNWWDGLRKSLTAPQKRAIRFVLEYLLVVAPAPWNGSEPNPPGNLLVTALANCWNQF